MRVTSLGHTECLIECTLSGGEVFRVLLDSWLSDYCVADCMERSPRITIDWTRLPQIDIVYISHAHLDHLDPYFLTELYAHQSPVLLLAETLAYLVPTLKAYLPAGTHIDLLRQLEPQTFMREVTLTGLIYTSDDLTNEEEVMTLFVAHKDTCAYFEIDTVPPLIAEEQEKLLELFTASPFTSRLYIMSANELEGNLPILDLASTRERKEFAEEYSEYRATQIEERIVICTENQLPLARIWQLSGFKQVVTGQGLQFPSFISTDLAGTKIMSLSEVATLHNQLFSQSNIRVRVTALTAGKTVGGEDGSNLLGLQFGAIIKPSLDHTAVFSRRSRPQRTEICEIEPLDREILETLNTRFLPTKLADPIDNLKALLLEIPSRQYIIGVDYSVANGFERRYYGWGFGNTQFERMAEGNLSAIVSSDGKIVPSAIQELYFANDLADFLLGSQELYSSFVHTLDPKLNYRLWTVLGNSFLNNNLVIRKVAHHFEAAKSGKKSDDVLEFYR